MPGGCYLSYTKQNIYIYMDDPPNVLSLRLLLYMAEKQGDWLEQSLYDNAPPLQLETGVYIEHNPVSGSVEFSLDSIVLSILDPKIKGSKTTD